MGLMVYATFNIVSVIYHIFAICEGGRWEAGYSFFSTFNNDSVSYHSFAVGRGAQVAHVLCHLQYLVIYHTFAVGWGVQGAHGLCHIQYCFSYLPLLCCRQGGQEDQVFCHFQNMFQSFSTPLL